MKLQAAGTGSPWQRQGRHRDVVSLILNQGLIVMCTIYWNKKWALSYIFKVWETRFGSESWFLIAMRSSGKHLLPLCFVKSGNNPAGNISAALSPFLPPAHFKLHLPTAGPSPAKLLTSDSFTVSYISSLDIPSNTANHVTAMRSRLSKAPDLANGWCTYL